MVATLLWRLCTRSSSRYWLVKSQVVYRQILGGLGRGSRIISPLRFECPSYIYVGERVTVNRFCWLGAYPQKGFDQPRLSIGDGAQIGHFNHITCINRVEIGANVLTADRVHISDNEHIFANVGIPVMKQGVTSRGAVVLEKEHGSEKTRTCSLARLGETVSSGQMPWSFPMYLISPSPSAYRRGS